MKAKYSHYEMQTGLEFGKIELQMLENNKDEALERYKQKDGAEMKGLKKINVKVYPNYISPSCMTL